MKRPVYLRTGDVAKVLGWRTTRARNWLARANALVSRGGRLVTTPTLLRNAFPEVWEEIMLALDDEDDDDAQ